MKQRKATYQGENSAGLSVLLSLLLLMGCAIENDIPYPTVEGIISAIEVEGQCDTDGNSSTETTFNRSAYTASLYVDDTVDLSKLRITKLTVTNEAELTAEEEACYNFEKFPTSGFSSLDELPLSADTRMNFTNPVTFTLHTYQDYLWTVTVEQIIKRTILLDGQIGNAVIDELNHNVVIYVSEEMTLSALAVTTFDLGGPHGTVTPDPTEYETYDFSEPCTFYVKCGWEETSQPWTVYVFHGEETNASDVFARVTSATITGNIRSGEEPLIEYREQSASSWNTFASSEIYVSGTQYTATLVNLSPNTTYQYRVTINGITGSTQMFTTAKIVELTDGSFDNWHLDGSIYCPWASDGTSFWDTGNRGVATVGSSNSIPTEDTCNGSGLAGELSSKWIVLKFGAGNIFTGSYVETDGTNAILSFGREFSSFPSKLRINYKYTTTTIDHVGDDLWNDLKGRPDSCFIYIALTDWDEPREIRTRPSERQLFEKDDPHVIAYAELIKGEDVPNWTQTDLVLDYRYTDRTPKYILVVATASKYGDYFTGGSGSQLYVDNFELLYDD